MTEISKSSGDASSDLISFVLSGDWDLSIHLSTLPLLVLGMALVSLWLIARWWLGRSFPDFEIDAAELGFGDQKISFKPNQIDRQIAYSIWVELSTRKIGLPIDLNDDVITEIYDSWYSFFGVTRELIKEIPASKVRKDSTSKIIHLSIEVLNEGLRPHLTKWQARFRHWYERQIEDKFDASPQDMQKKFPDYEALRSDMEAVNVSLMNYRIKMYDLVNGTKHTNV
tara:strand:+ start:5510 stop:6187 length:678 start_codon:yes stop_codon:yes gene_type:complete